MISALDSLARIAAERTVNSVAAGVVLTILAWSLLRLVPRTNARTRVAVWLSVLAAIPALSVAAIFIGKSQSSLADQSARIVVPEGWAFAIFVAWGAIAIFALLRVAFGLWRVRCLRRACTSLNLANIEPSVIATIERFRPLRAVALLESENARVPMAVGFFRPAVILPKWALSELSCEELSAIFIHEFAHLRRWDDWTNFFQKIVRAVFFFHPSLWWLDRRLALDREIACDDAVLAATNKAHDYARCLVDLAEKSLVRRSLALAQAAVHRAQHISVRISQILDSTRPRAARVSKILLAGVTALAGVCLVAVLKSPTLIAFQDGIVATAAPVVAMPGPRVATAASAVRPNNVPEPGSATVIPVVMRERVNIAPRSFTRAGKANLAALTKSQEVVIPAKFVPRKQQQPRLVRASLSLHRQSVIPVESIFFVIPDASFDPSGRVVWTLSVWRVTVFHPVQPPVEGMLSSSI